MSATEGDAGDWRGPRRPPIGPDPIRLAVCVSGGGRTLANLLERIGDGRLRAEVALVVASRPGIGAIGIAERAGIETLIAERAGRPVSEHSAGIFAAIRRARADLAVLAGYLQLLEIPDDYAGKVINIHPSLIPAFCGKGQHGERVHAAALARGVKVSGCTAHYADNTYDTGPIILQRTVPVEDDDTVETLARRVFEAECEALPEAIARHAAGDVVVEGNRTRRAAPR